MKAETDKHNRLPFVTFPVISSLLTLVLGWVISEVQDKIGLAMLLVALGFFLLTYVLTLVVVGSQFQPASTRLLQEIHQHLDRDAIGMIDTAELVRRERQLSSTEIWLITGDLLEDVPGEPFFDVVHENLGKEVHYTYFCPKSLRNEGRATTIAERHADTAGKLSIVYLAEDFFFLTPRLDFTIFDPYNKTGKRVGYMGLPMKGEQHFHCPMDQDLLDSLVGKLSGELKKGEG